MANTERLEANKPTLKARLETLFSFSNLKLSNIAQSEDELERRRSLLSFMMIATILFIVLTGPVLWGFSLTSQGDNWSLLLMLLASTVGLSFNFFGRLRTTGYIYVVSIAIALLVRSWFNLNGSLANLSFNYFAVGAIIIFAGLTIDEIAPFFVALGTIFSFAAIFLVHASQVPNDTVSTAQIFVYGTTLHIIMAVMAWLNARTNSRVFSRMTWQNSELLKVNTQLEQNIQLDSVIGDTISQLSDELSHISHDQSERAHSQAQSVAIVTSTLEELSATARQIAEVAESVFTATEQALRTAEIGGQSVGLSIDSISSLTVHVEGINEIANRLGSQSRRISEIVETITELAEETNLLALNATIEAAGAGEYGRRFAVVASEVQLLANRSRAASRDVQTILSQIRKSIDSTLVATDQGMSEARRMSQVASQAGESIEQIIETVESTTFLSRQIFLTTQQQRSATDQAVEMVRQVAGDSREAAVRAQQLLVASDHLSQTANRLRGDN